MKKGYLIGIPILATIFIVSLFAFSFINLPTLNQNQQGVDHNALVCIYKNGEQIGECSHNTLFTDGANFTRDCLRTGTCSAVTNITLCNATAGCTHSLTSGPASGQTFNTFTGCGVSPTETAGTPSINTGSAGNWTITKTYTSTCDSISTNVTRIGNTTTYFAGNNFSSVTLQTNDQLTVNWTIWVSSA